MVGLDIRFWTKQHVDHSHIAIDGGIVKRRLAVNVFSLSKGSMVKQLDDNDQAILTARPV
jgi:hypothetical protein